MSSTNTLQNDGHRFYILIDGSGKWLKPIYVEQDPRYAGAVDCTEMPDDQMVDLIESRIAAAQKVAA